VAIDNGIPWREHESFEAADALVHVCYRAMRQSSMMRSSVPAPLSPATWYLGLRSFHRRH